MEENVLRLTVEFDRETDGRWIADLVDEPGVLAYGHTKAESLSSVLRLYADVVDRRERDAIREATASLWKDR